MRKNEKIADIVAEMRGARTEFPFVYLMGEPDTPEVIDAKTKEIIEPRKINIRRVTVNELADRIEKSAKREELEKLIIDSQFKDAVLDFCDVFTMVYPPNDKDCPAVLSAAFEIMKERLGIETVNVEETSKSQEERN